MGDARSNSGWRVQALELAIKTVATAQRFTVAQIINTADQYEKFISDGTVPPLAAAPVVDAKAEALANAPGRLQEGDDAELVD